MSENIIKTPFCPRIELVGDTPVLIKDEHGNYQSLESFLKNPTRTRLNETLQVFDSFIEAVDTRFNKDAAAIYTVPNSQRKFNDFKFIAYANDCRKYHAWREEFTFIFKSEFMKNARDWIECDEKLMSQDDFALFLDKHINDIRCVDPELQRQFPTQMELFNFVSTLQDSKSDRFTRKVNIQNGDMTVSLERESDDGTKQQLKLFERFPIVLQIYEGFPMYQVTAKLRFRIRDGQVAFWYDIEGLEEMFIAARNWAVNELKEKTGLPVYI